MENPLNHPAGLLHFCEDQDFFQDDFSLHSLPVFPSDAAHFQVNCPQELSLMTLINVPKVEPQNLHFGGDGLKIFSHEPLRDPIICQQSNTLAANKTGKEVLQKKTLRLISHRKANQEYRQRNKEYLKRLERQVAELEKKNKALLEQIQDVKRIFEHNVQ